jgi:hypothetical protein
VLHSNIPACETQAEREVEEESIGIPFHPSLEGNGGYSFRYTYIIYQIENLNKFSIFIILCQYSYIVY